MLFDLQAGRAQAPRPFGAVTGERITDQKVHSGGPPNPTYKTEHYYYDGVRRVQEVDDNATPANTGDDDTKHEYVYGPQYVDEFVLQSQRTVVDEQVVQKPFYMLQDANYNVMALLDDTGAVVEQYQWEPYGSLAALDTTASPRPDNPVGHQGLFFYRFDGADSLSLNTLGLYYNRNRWYSPSLGRFTSRDPNETAQLVVSAMLMNAETPLVVIDTFSGQLHFNDGMNLHGYLGVNPVGRSDSTGLFFSYMDVMSATALQSDLIAQEGDISVSLVRAIRGIAGLLQDRNLMIDDTMDLAASGPDWATIDTALDCYQRYQEARMALAIGGVLQIGLKAALRSAGRGVVRGARGAVSYTSFAAFKRAMGSAGTGKVWHHIVEQCQEGRFGAAKIHNTKNIIPLDAGLNTKLNALYSSKRAAITGSQHLTVRGWLKTKSYDFNRSFGRQAIENVRKGVW